MSARFSSGMRLRRTAISCTASDIFTHKSQKFCPITSAKVKVYGCAIDIHQRGKKISLARLFFMSLLLLPATVVASEVPPIVAAEGGPVVLPGEQGAPDKININAPDPYGLSYNPFVEFHVGEQGVEFNNTTAEASIIFNDVKGNTSSELNGDLIVKGRPADVVISNPNGINCNGCGFVNSSRGVLTTGKSVFENGRLTGLEVSRGQINVEKDGLIIYDPPEISQGKIDLIAAGVTLNGFMHGGVMRRRAQYQLPEEDRPGNAFLEKVQVIAGNYRVNLQQGKGSKRISGYEVERYGETTPRENGRIDVQDVGGMLARQIYLHGNDAGIGVNSNGAIWGVEKFVINTKGELTLGSRIIATELIDISNADRVVNLNGLEADKLVFKNIGHFRNGDDLTALKNPRQLSLPASMGLQEIKGKDIHINAREFHNYARISADNRLELTANKAHNSGELTAAGLTINADNLTHQTHIYQEDKRPVAETVYQSECYDDSCWQYPVTVEVPREKYRDIPGKMARIVGKDALNIDVKNDLTITGATLESPGGSVQVNAGSVKIMPALLEEKTTASQKHTDRWLFIPVKSSETKTTTVKQEVLKANLQADKALVVNSQGSMVIKGASLSGNSVDITSKEGSLDIRSLYLTRLSTEESSKAGFLGLNRTEVTTDIVEQMPVDTAISPSQKLSLTAKNNIHLDNANDLFLLTNNGANGLNVVISADKVIKASQPYLLTKNTREK